MSFGRRRGPYGWEELMVAMETVLDRARAGDDRAFGELTDPFLSGLRLHCYRILGSVQDAEDVLQETTDQRPPTEASAVRACMGVRADPAR
jgi:hypothetical protein